MFSFQLKVLFYLNIKILKKQADIFFTCSYLPVYSDFIYGISCDEISRTHTFAILSKPCSLFL